MREAVIVSYARTGLAKAARGGFNNTSNMAMLGHAVKHAVERSKADPADVEDVVAGCVAASGNVARGAALLAGLPITTSGSTVHRAWYCHRIVDIGLPFHCANEFPNRRVRLPRGTSKVGWVCTASKPSH